MKDMEEDHIEKLQKCSANGELTFIIEAVDSVDRGALVISSQQEEVLGVLEGKTIKHWRYFEALEKAIVEMIKFSGLFSIYKPNNIMAISEKILCLSENDIARISA